MEGKSGKFNPPPLVIGNVVVDPPLVLAPMAGITDDIFRCIMAEHGVGLVTTEMISTEGILRSQPATWRLCTQEPPLQIPLAVQLFGRDPVSLAEAARRMETRGASIIDINAGCPVKKVVRQGAGADLLKDMDRLAGIVEEVKKAVCIPVTVKIRLGWDDHSKEPVEIAKRLESAGVDAITVHGRTAVQQYRGRAEWSWIKRVKDAVGVPIIGNGDVTTPALAEEMLLRAGCDAVMIGRGSLGNPWLLSTIAAKWGRRPASCDLPGWDDFLTTVHRHLEDFRRKAQRPAGHYRKILIWYSKGCPESNQIRFELAGMEQPESMLRHFRVWVGKIMQKGVPFLPCKV